MRTLVALTLFGSVVAAGAQPATDIRTSTDPARAAAIEQRAQNMKQGADGQPVLLFHGTTEKGVPILSGGVTVKDRVDMRKDGSRYNVWVATVAKPSGAYLADAKLRLVSLSDRSVVLERTMEGPWLFADLAPGRYEVTGTFKAEGKEKAQTLSERISVARQGQRQVVFRFESPATVAPDMESPFKGNPFGSASAAP